MVDCLARLLPPPKSFEVRSGECPLTTGCTVAFDDDDLAPNKEALAEITRAWAPVAGEKSVPVSVRRAADSGPEGYRLTIERAAISFEAATAAGTFYGLQTLRQLALLTEGIIPCGTIVDEPAFPARGYYYDISRGRVPTLEALYAMVRLLASYKYNQLQLYMEHTYAFQNHPDIWQGADPLTAEDIRSLDEYCQKHYIELVPSLSCFGHFCTPLRSPRKAHLNELELDASLRAFSWWDRIRHYTLDCRNPESLRLIDELMTELRGVFSSDKFNICCDETFDLGKGRNAAEAKEMGKGRLYVDFVKALCSRVLELGATPMLWGDIIAHHFELADELPQEAIFLEWNYDPKLGLNNLDAFARSGRPFYVCPGVQGWNRFVAHHAKAWENIRSFAARALPAGARGVLNTDWGDCGHVNLFAQSLYGVAVGGCAAWHPEAPLLKDRAVFDRSWSHIQFLDTSGEVAALSNAISELAAAANWELMNFFIDISPDLPDEWFEPPHRIPHAALKVEDAVSLPGRVNAIREKAERLRSLSLPEVPDVLLARNELAVGAEGAACILETLYHFQGVTGADVPEASVPLQATADHWRHFEAGMSQAWHATNRPSEYFRIRLAIMDIATRLDRIALSR